MKIYIGPYARTYRASNWFDAYIGRVHKKPCWDVLETDYTKIDKVVEKICDGLDAVFRYTINKISHYRALKVKVKIHPYDTWSGDWSLSQVIYPWLLQYKLDNQHTTPTDEEIDAMIFSFKEIAEERADGDQFGSGNMDIHIEEHEDVHGITRSKLVHGPEYTYKFDEEANQEYQKKIQDGIDIFAKNFRGLWT